MAGAAIVLSLAVRLWTWLRRRTFELAISSNQGNAGRRDATEHRNFDLFARERDETAAPFVYEVMGIDVANELPNLSSVGHAVEIGAVELFEDLFSRHYADVFRYALVLTKDRDEAEEVAAETFARGWRAWRNEDEPAGKALAWLLVIARNIATDRWRRLSRHVGRLQPPNTSDTHAEVETMLWLQSLVRVLPPRQREVIALRYHRDLSDADIGRLMGLSESGVRSLVGRALATLRQHPEAWR